MGVAAEPTKAIIACYEAVFRPELWPSALQSLAADFGAISSALRCCDKTHPLTADRRGRAEPVPDSTEHAEFTDLWLERVEGAPDPHIDRPRRLQRKGRLCFVVEDDITTDEERRTLPYYNEIAVPGHREWWAVISFPANNCTWCLSVYRGARRGRYEPHDGGRFISVAPHLSRIVSAAESLGGVVATSTIATLDRLGCPAVLLDQCGRLRQSNERAEPLLRSYLVVRHGRLRAKDQASDTRLQALIADVTSNQPELRRPVAPAVISHDGIPQLLAEAMPMTSLGNDLFGGGATVLYFTDLACGDLPDESRLRAAFGLTSAEARLAARLAGGKGVEVARAGLAIGRETARTHLRSIFSKTGTRRQAELAAVLARLRVNSKDSSDT